MSTSIIAHSGYELKLIQIMGSWQWYITPYREGLGYNGSPMLSGRVPDGEVHTERLEEVLSYIANEIGATFG